MRPYHFRDSILFTSDSLPLTWLPKSVDTLKFKILSHKQIDSIFAMENDLRKIPNYLNIRTFEKNDTGYLVIMESEKDLGFFPGSGVILIDIGKLKDSFIVKHTSSSNIN